jgi:HAD superfamily hydrolase (TIGR01459 family)
MPDSKIIAGLRDIADRFDVVLLDLWGCVHDGVKPYPRALDCLQRLKAAGKSVAIVSNAPRRAAGVIAKLAEMGVARELYRDLFASGEETWRYLKTRPDGLAQRLGRRAYPIMTDRDLDILEGLDLELVDTVAAASFLLVTGVADEKVKVGDFDPVLKPAAHAMLPMVCANPDLLVHRGGIEEICAGAIAERYEKMGGRVVYHGKPHRKIYEIIFKAFGIDDPKRVIGVGDSFRTDVKGAAEMGAGSVLIAGGIHRMELLRGNNKLDPGQLATLSRNLAATPDFALPYLAW